jgi:hypothetical protein
MQACELEVRSAAADEAAAASSSMAGMQGLSALDRKAVMEAMGQAEPQGPKQQLPLSPVRSSPAFSTSPPRHQGLTAQAQAGPSHYGGAQPGGYYGYPPPPPPPRQQAVPPPPEHVEIVDAFIAKRQSDLQRK